MSEVQSGRPTLHEIAAMPFPASQAAMRQFYDPKWGTEAADGKRRFKITADYSYTVGENFEEEIEAESEQEAKDIAHEMIEDQAGGDGDVEVHSMKVEEIEEC